jgi:hypothetical protein
VLKKAFGFYFDPTQQSPTSNTDFWAEEVAVVVGHLDGGLSGHDVYYGNDQFICTNKVVLYLMKYGTIVGREVATVGGTVSAGSIKITFTDPALVPNPQPIMVSVAGTDSLATIATNLTTAINNNTNLSTHGISATSSGPNVGIKGNSSTTYSESVTGTETLSLTPTSFPTLPSGYTQCASIK